ncbi:MAG: flagellar brake protein [Gammaproteobacteria bacterium]|nr:flagellar brake protein [Gammaproteobacteria bacterium]
MFEAFHKLLHSEKGNPITPGPSYEIENQEEITYLLSLAFKSRTLLSARIKGQEEIFTTAIIGIYDEYDFFVMDELTPNQGNPALIEAREILLFGRLDGVELRFRSSLIQENEKNGIAFYKMTLPKKILYRQKRLDHRISTSSINIPFRGRVGKGVKTIITGHVTNLSRKGIGIILDNRIDVHAGEVIPTCKVNLPGEGNILFSLEVCFYAWDNHNNRGRIGGKFCKIDASCQRKIQRTLKRIERARVKRQGQV